MSSDKKVVRLEKAYFDFLVESRTDLMKHLQERKRRGERRKRRVSTG